MKARKRSPRKPFTSETSREVQSPQTDLAWEKVSRSRYSRDLKRLQTLKRELKYPTDSEMSQIAGLAKVPADEWFARHIREIIFNAHLDDRSLKGLSIPAVRGILEHIETAALGLDGVLQAVDVSGNASAAHAGRLLEFELTKLRGAEGISLLPAFTLALRALAQGAKGARLSLKSKRGPKAIFGSSALELFAVSLLMAAKQRNGKWTIDRNGGSLLDAVTLLLKYLPKNFTSGGTLARSLEHIREGLRDHITKNLEQGS
jgi:hypothetical protein